MYTVKLKNLLSFTKLVIINTVECVEVCHHRCIQHPKHTEYDTNIETTRAAKIFGCNPMLKSTRATASMATAALAPLTDDVMRVAPIQTAHHAWHKELQDVQPRHAFSIS